MGVPDSKGGKEGDVDGGGGAGEGGEVTKGRDRVGGRDKTRHWGGSRGDSQGEGPVGQPRGQGGGVEERAVEFAGGAASEREPLYGGPPIRGKSVHQVRQEVGVRCSRGGERPGLGVGSRGDGGKRTKRAMGRRGDVNVSGVTGGETPGEGREKMNHVSDATQSQARKESVHLFSPRQPIRGGGGREAAMSATVPPGVRTIRGDTGAISAREVRVVRQGLKKHLKDGWGGRGGRDSRDGGEITQKPEGAAPEGVRSEGEKITVGSQDAEIEAEDPVGGVEVGEQVMLVKLHGGADSAEKPGGTEARSKDRDVKSAGPKVRVVVDKGFTRDEAVELTPSGSSGR